MQAEPVAAPVSETFGHGPNLRLVLAALFAVIGQAALFYMGTFYAYYFLERVARVDPLTVTLLTGTALAIAAPLVVASGWLSDRVGRKPLLLGAAALAALLYFPLFGALLSAANPALAKARETSPVVVAAVPGDCSLLFDPVGRRNFDAHSCDVVKSWLARAGISHAMRDLPAPGPAQLEIGDRVIVAPDVAALAGEGRKAAISDFQGRAAAALAEAGYREKAEPGEIHRPRVIAILVLLLAFAAASSGAYAALLAEMFPARIRYTALSFPQNFGNGWFGGCRPRSRSRSWRRPATSLPGSVPGEPCGDLPRRRWLAVPETRGRPIG
jgi:hypothetical protein